MSKLEFYQNFEDIKTAIFQVLQLDPRSISRKKLEKSIFSFYIDNLNVICDIEEDVCTVKKIDLITEWDELVKNQHEKVVKSRLKKDDMIE